MCRRAERLVTGLVETGAAAPATAQYLNRLSDLFFVQSRWIAKRTGVPETLWRHGLEAPATKAPDKAGKTGKKR